MSLTPYERETIITQNDEDRSIWHVYTRQRTVMNKMMKIGIEPIKIIEEDGSIYSAEYIISSKNLCFKKESKEYHMSDEDREKKRQQMLAYHNSKKQD